jgi:hypothetical protein
VAGAFPASSDPVEIAAGVSPSGRPGVGSISAGGPAGVEAGSCGGIPCSKRPMPPPGCGIGVCGIAGGNSGSKPPGCYPVFFLGGLFPNCGCPQGSSAVLRFIG